MERCSSEEVDRFNVRFSFVGVRFRGLESRRLICGTSVLIDDVREEVSMSDRLDN